MLSFVNKHSILSASVLCIIIFCIALTGIFGLFIAQFLPAPPFVDAGYYSVFSVRIVVVVLPILLLLILLFKDHKRALNIYLVFLSIIIIAPLGYFAVKTVLPVHVENYSPVVKNLIGLAADPRASITECEYKDQTVYYLPHGVL
jgi:hypothetical protein